MLAASNLGSAPVTDPGREVALVQGSLLSGQINSDRQDEPPPCACKCGGKIQCDKGEWSFCECRRGKCDTTCRKGKNKPLELAADVTSVVVEKEITVTRLKEESNVYSPILSSLLRGKLLERTYHLKYKDRDIGFSFNPRGVALLTEAVNELQKIRPVSGGPASTPVSPVSGSVQGKAE